MWHMIFYRTFFDCEFYLDSRKSTKVSQEKKCLAFRKSIKSLEKLIFTIHFKSSLYSLIWLLARCKNVKTSWNLRWETILRGFLIRNLDKVAELKMIGFNLLRNTVRYRITTHAYVQVNDVLSWIRSAESFPEFILNIFFENHKFEWRCLDISLRRFSLIIDVFQVGTLTIQIMLLNFF